MYLAYHRVSTCLCTSFPASSNRVWEKLIKTSISWLKWALVNELDTLVQLSFLPSNHLTGTPTIHSPLPSPLASLSPPSPCLSGLAKFCSFSTSA